MSPPTINIQKQVHLTIKEKLKVLDDFLEKIQEHHAVFDAEPDEDLRKQFLSDLEEIKDAVLTLRKKVKQSGRNFFKFKDPPTSAEVIAFEVDLKTIMESYEQQSSLLREIVQENIGLRRNLNARRAIYQPPTPVESPQETSEPVSNESPGSHSTHSMPVRTDLDDERPAASSGEEPTQFEHGWAAFPVPRYRPPEMQHRPRDLEEEERRSHQREISIVEYESLPPPPRTRPLQPFEDFEAQIEDSQAQEHRPATQRNLRPFSNAFGPQPDLESSSSGPTEDSSEQELTAFIDEGNHFSDEDDMYV